MSCYQEINGTINAVAAGVDNPCNPAAAFSPCCPLAAGGICLDSLLCYEPSPPAGRSGYLISSCTDPSYQSDQCTRHCVDNPVPDVVYNPTTALWACCGVDVNGVVDCTNPTDETFVAPPPAALLSTGPGNSSSSTSSTLSSNLSISTSQLPTTTSFLATSSKTILSTTPIIPSTSTSSLTSTTLSAKFTISTFISTSRTSSTGSTSLLAPATSTLSSQDIASGTPSLSLGAKAGVGIGTTIGIVGLVSFCTWLVLLALRRYRKSKNQWEFGPPDNPRFVSELDDEHSRWYRRPDRHLHSIPEVHPQIHVARLSNSTPIHTRAVPVGRWRVMNDVTY